MEHPISRFPRSDQDTNAYNNFHSEKKLAINQKAESVLLMAI